MGGGAIDLRLDAPDALDADDRDALRGLWRRAWRRAYEAWMPAPALRSLLALTDAPDLSSMLPEDALLARAFRSGRLAGSAIVREGEDAGYLWGCYVDPGELRSGVGSRLLDAVLATQAARARLTAMALEASADALAFYRARGFVRGETTTLDVDGHLFPAVWLTLERG